MTVKNRKNTDKPHLYKEGETGNPNGRPQGSKNKVPADIAKQVVACYEKMGGLEAMVEHFSQPRNRTLFYTRMLAPLMPKTVEATLHDDADLAGRMEKLKEADERLKANE